MFTSAYQRRLFIALGLMALTAVPVVISGQLAMRHIRTSPTKWVPAWFTVRKEYDQFVKDFETNDAVVISWEGCALDDPRLAKVRDVLAEPDDSERGEKVKLWVERVFTGASLIDEMSGIDPQRLKPKVIHERLEGSLISAADNPSHGGTTCCVVLLTADGVANRKQTVPLLVELVAEQTGLEKDELHLVGPIVDAYTIDTESVASMRVFVLPSALIVLLLCRVCLRSWPYTFLVFGIAVYGEMLTLALVRWSGETMNAVLIVMPPLVLVLTVSAAVHLVNYYHDEVRRSGFENAPRKALKMGLLPCALATGTTAIGLTSLILSDIIPVKLFGIYSTAGIVTTLVLLFLTLPGAQERWPVKPREKREGFFKDLSGIANFCCRYPTLIVLACLTLMVACGWGLQWMNTSVNVRSLFTSDSKILNDYRWFEKHIGPMTPVELVLHFNDSDERDPLDQLEVVDEIQYRMERIDGLGGTMSAATFFPPLPAPRPQVPQRRFPFKKRVEDNLGKFDDINYFKDKPSEREQAWRISGRVAALGDEEGKEADYGKFLDMIQREVDPRLWAFHHFLPIQEAFREFNDQELEETKVLLVGAPLKSVLARLDALKDSTKRDELPPATETEIFLDELHYLLTHRRFVTENMTSLPASKLPDDLSEYEAVILVDAPGIDAGQLAAGDGVRVFDARMHSLAALPDGQRDPRAVTATYTGVMPLAYEVQRVLLKDLIKSFLAAAALVTIVMIILQRSAFAGVVAMVPNVFPMIVLFGITSWRGMPIDIGTVMTASVALGIAVDDTLHFLTWFNREHSDTGDNKAGVRLAFRHCAKAMLQTTLICSLGLAIYSFSWFMPTRRFSWMMVTLLMAAVGGDLILLPSLLASPLGRWFPQRKLMGDPMAKPAQPAPVESTPTANPTR